MQCIVLLNERFSSSLKHLDMDAAWWWWSLVFGILAVGFITMPKASIPKSGSVVTCYSTQDQLNKSLNWLNHKMNLDTPWPLIFNSRLGLSSSTSFHDEKTSGEFQLSCSIGTIPDSDGKKFRFVQKFKVKMIQMIGELL